MACIRRKATLTIAALALLAMTQAWADTDAITDSIRFSGFGTLGVTKGGDEEFGFRRDLSRDGQSSGGWAIETDSLFGVQFDAALTSNLDATIQLVAKNRPTNSLNDSLEWAFLRNQPTQELTFRVGRLGVDIFMLSEYRNVGFAYLWARPPMEFYGLLAYENIDGADLAYSRPWGDGTLRIKLFGGKTTENIAGVRSDDYAVDLTSYGTSLSWESERWQARVAFVTGTVDNTISSATSLINGLNAVPSVVWSQASQLADSIDSKGKRVTYYSAGARYDDSPWVVQTELSFTDSQLMTLPLASAYLSVGRRIGPVTAYGMAAKAKNPDGRKIAASAPLPIFSALQQGVQYTYDTSNIDQHSLSAGLRWDIRHDLALKAQWDHHWIDAYGGGLWAQKRVFPEARELDTFSINFNFVF